MDGARRKLDYSIAIPSHANVLVRRHVTPKPAASSRTLKRVN